jgi:RNA polymerase sigma-70 factor (ECF subfamily)
VPADLFTVKRMPTAPVARGEARPVEPDRLDDHALVEVAKHDRAAFAVLYRRHVDGVYRYAHRLCGGDQAVAEDVTSATFEKAMAAIGRFEWRGGGVRPWLLRIASAEVAGWYRTRQRTIDKGARAAGDFQRTQGLLLGGAPATDGPSGSRGPVDERADAVLDALAALPERYRDVIALRYLAGLSPAEAAAAMDCSVNTLNVTLHRALESLRTTVSSRSASSARRSERSSHA